MASTGHIDYICPGHEIEPDQAGAARASRMPAAGSSPMNDDRARARALSLSIAAASIIAKVTRDRMMRELDMLYPGYYFAKNAGYGTQDHQNALQQLGITPHHRKSFAPIKKLLAGISHKIPELADQ